MATIVWGNERAVVEFGHQLEKTRLCIGWRLAERYTERPSLVSAASHQCFLALVNVDTDPIAGGVRVLAEQRGFDHSTRIRFWRFVSSRSVKNVIPKLIGFFMSCLEIAECPVHGHLGWLSETSKHPHATRAGRC